MYSANYGFPNAAGQTFNGAPPSQNAHLQPGQGPNPNQQPSPQHQQHQQQHQQHQQHQHQQQHQQPMMYNPQQFPMGAQGAAASAFPGAPNMMPGVGPAGAMMQNTGMPHMAAANGQMPNYQSPYSGSPYGGGVPTSVAPQMNVPPNYSMGGGMSMSGFPMHPGQMTPQQQQQHQQHQQQQHQHQQQHQQQQHQHQQQQHQQHQQHQHQQHQQQHQHHQQQMMQQRMPPHPQNAGGMPNATPQRQFPGQNQGQIPHGTPTPNNGMSSQQGQFPAPPNPQGTPQSQTPNNGQQQPQPMPSTNIQTPQTPTFPSNVQAGSVNGASASAGPLSPGADSRDKERLAVILEINNELLVEAMQIQHTQSVLKKEHASPKEGAGSDGDKKDKEEEALAQDYLQCMRRLQTNLAYLAALADKKGSTQLPPCPAYLKAPPLHTKIKLRAMQGPDGTEGKAEPSDRDETAKYITELYLKLQGLYPDVDPNKEPTFQMSGNRQGTNTAKPGVQTPSQASPVPGNKQTPTMPAAATPAQLQSNQHIASTPGM